MRPPVANRVVALAPDVDNQAGPFRSFEHQVLVKPPTATLSTTFTLHAGKYVEGEGFATISGMTFATCQSRCLTEARCAMFELYKPKGQCNLYMHNRIAGPSAYTDVGIKRATAVQPSNPLP